MLKDYDSNIEYYVMKGIIDVCKKDITVVRSCFNIRKKFLNIFQSILI